MAEIHSLSPDFPPEKEREREHGAGGTKGAGQEWHVREWQKVCQSDDALVKCAGQAVQSKLVDV